MLCAHRDRMTRSREPNPSGAPEPDSIKRINGEVCSRCSAAAGRVYGTYPHRGGTPLSFPLYLQRTSRFVVRRNPRESGYSYNS